MLFEDVFARMFAFWRPLLRVAKNNIVLPVLVCVMVTRPRYVEAFLAKTRAEFFLRWLLLYTLSPLFGISKILLPCSWYKRRYADCNARFMLMFHVLREHQLRDPTVMFSTFWYKSRYGIRDGISPAIHYLLVGHKAQVETTPLPSGDMQSLYEDMGFTVFSGPGRYSTPPEIIDAYVGDLEGNINSPHYDKRIVRLKIDCIGSDEMRERGLLNDVASVKVQFVRIPVPWSVFGTDVEFREICKAGCRQHMYEVDGALAIGGLSLFISKEGLQIFDALVKFCRHRESILLSNSFHYKYRGDYICLYKMSHEIPSGILLTYDVEGNYFHWMLELLPRLKILLEQDLYKDVPLLVTKGLGKNFRRSIELLVPGREIIEIPRHHAVKVKQLICLTPINATFERLPVNQLNSYFRVDVPSLQFMARRMKECVLSVGSSPANVFAGSKRLFVTRKGSSRNIINANAVESYLSSNFFAVLDTAKISIDDQILIFHNANIVILQGGAAVSNIIYCRKGAHVCVLMPSGTEHCCNTWRSLAAVSGVHISFIFGYRKTAFSPDQVEFYFAKFTISIDMLARYLESVYTDLNHDLNW